MAVFQNSIIPAAAAASDSAYSCRFDGTADTTGAILLKEDFSGATTTFTFSAWVKRGKISTSWHQYLVFWGDASGDDNGIRFTNTSGTDDELSVYNGSSFFPTDGVYRDPGAWYHVCLSVSSGTGTLYVNGTSVKSSITGLGAPDIVQIGAWWDSGPSPSGHFSGLMADIHWIDGTAEVPSDFAETDSNGLWVPKEYDGTYGDNGFRLDFADDSDLGNDVSGNNNDFTTTNLGSHDQVIDTPTAGNNYATLSPLAKSSGMVLAEGNLKASPSTSSGTNFFVSTSTIGMSSGQWYAEAYVYSGGQVNLGYLGVSLKTGDDSDRATSGNPNGTQAWDAAILYAGYTYVGGSSQSVDPDLSNGDIVGVAVDADDNKVYFFKNGTAIGSSSGYAFGASGDTYFFSASTRYWTSLGGSGISYWNFGQDATFAGEDTGSAGPYADGNSKGEFYYSPPSGYKALCTANLPAPGRNNAVTSEKSFDVSTWDGSYDLDNESGTESQNIDVGFHPGIVWVKDRDNLAASSSMSYSTSVGHWLFDVLRGSGYAHNVDNDAGTSDDGLPSTEDGISSFAWTSGGSSGFTVHRAAETNYTDGSTDERYVGWSWKLGTTGSPGGNTTSEKLNADAGISLIEWAGVSDGSDITLNHSMGNAVEMGMFFEGGSRSNSHMVWHKDLGSGKRLLIEDDSSQTTSSGDVPSGGVSASSTQITLGTDWDMTSATYYGLLFASIEGYSKVGSYTGNGSTDGPFVHLGFKPAFVMVKRFTGTGGWSILDSARNTYNPADINLSAEASGADYQNSTYSLFTDFLSNGFKIRNSQTGFNSNTYDFAYYAVADNPFKYGNGR